MDTVPFHFDTYGGLGEVKGLARLDDDGLELQFSTSDALFGVLKSDRQVLRVSLDSLLSVQYRSGFLWLAPGIELRVRDLAALKGLPETDEGRIHLGLRFRDRRDGRAFAAELELLRSRRRIQHLDRTLDRLVSPLPMDAVPPALPGAQVGRRPGNPQSET